MKPELKLVHYVGMALGGFIIILSLLILLPQGSELIKPGIALGIAIILFPFWLDFIKEGSRQREIEEKFLEFVRSITSNVKAGTPIPKATIESSESNYGALNPYIKKLRHQLEWGIPFREALIRFSKNTRNKVITRSVTIIIEAEQSGGNIQDVLEGVTSSVVQIKKIRDERRANSFSQIIQGYLVFFIFIAIMIVLQIFLLPQLADVSGDVFSGVTYTGGVTSGDLDSETLPVSINFENIFIFLILIQGLFAGLMVGKFSEGSIKYGVRHSFILMLVGYLAFTLSLGIF
jgi:archaeal flagellar protein FlaJ